LEGSIEPVQKIFALLVIIIVTAAAALKKKLLNQNWGVSVNMNNKTKLLITKDSNPIRYL
jgi:hypothetical protein